MVLRVLWPPCRVWRKFRLLHKTRRGTRIWAMPPIRCSPRPQVELVVWCLACGQKRPTEYGLPCHPLGKGSLLLTCRWGLCPPRNQPQCLLKGFNLSLLLLCCFPLLPSSTPPRITLRFKILRLGWLGFRPQLPTTIITTLIILISILFLRVHLLLLFIPPLLTTRHLLTAQLSSVRRTSWPSPEGSLLRMR